MCFVSETGANELRKSNDSSGYSACTISPIEWQLWFRCVTCLVLSCVCGSSSVWVESQSNGNFHEDVGYHNQGMQDQSQMQRMGQLEEREEQARELDDLQK